MEIKKVEFLQKFSQAFGPKFDKELIRNCIIALAILADQDTGEELMKMLRRM